MADQVAQPGGRVGQPGDQVAALDEGPVGMPLPASRAQAMGGMATQPAALDTDPRRVLGLARTRAADAPAGLGLQDPLLAASRAGRLGGRLGPSSPASAAVLPVQIADRGTAVDAVPLLLAHRALPPGRLRSAASTGRRRRSWAARKPAAAAGPAVQRAWCPPRTDRWGCTPTRCTTPPA